jgi:hypothetical protein
MILLAEMMGWPEAFAIAVGALALAWLGTVFLKNLP